ncbi:MAG: HAMP domain-containing protein [Gemmatimonadaceae bacterium]
MPISRLRVRLAAGFAIAFAVGLVLFAAGALGYLWRESSRRMEVHLAEVADGVARGVARELLETPDSSFGYAAREVVMEWPPSAGAFVILDSIGRVTAMADGFEQVIPAIVALSRDGGARFDAMNDGIAYRVQRERTVTTVAPRDVRAFEILAFASTAGIRDDLELLGGALLVAAPLMLLLSLVGGYLLAGRALSPVDALGASLTSMAPDDLSRRLPVATPADEIDTLARQFNDLLERLEAAQARNRRFVRETAHQIRTPLTLVLGEAEHALQGRDDAATPHAMALRRVKLAAEQMARRVDELFLLAEVEAGATIALTDDVELDGLALECTDLMRARATTLGRTLRLGNIDPVVVRGSTPLLREALLEMLENACRHGAPGVSVTTEVCATSGEALVIVRSGNSVVGAAAARGSSGEGQGLGMAIVRWIAKGHGGRFDGERDGDDFCSRLVLPLPVR